MDSLIKASMQNRFQNPSVKQPVREQKTIFLLAVITLLTHYSLAHSVLPLVPNIISLTINVLPCLNEAVRSFSIKDIYS